MPMGKMEKICSVMIMLGAENVELKTVVNTQGEKVNMVTFSSDAWKKGGISEEFNLITPIGNKNLTDRALNAQLYLYSANYTPKTVYEMHAVDAIKKYTKERTIGKCDIDKLYNNLSQTQAKYATVYELGNQEDVARKVYELLPKRDARKNVNTQSIAKFVNQISDTKDSRRSFDI